jgi:desulfoferrodoxin (superoxide reductase-like protein)
MAHKLIDSKDPDLASRANEVMQVQRRQCKVEYPMEEEEYILWWNH